MMEGNGQLSVPPGFRFHPTDEELLYYYLRKKVSYEPIDLDVIREVDLNKLEPWDLKDKCRIGSGPQNEWYFFSHKDKKYPTGTRTNRATAAGFWKATGRDKAIHLSSSSKRIGMRKTLVFYTGRAPHGQKTDWIMHEYRLLYDDDGHDAEVQEDGWVVCRVFKKKIHNRSFEPHDEIEQQQYFLQANNNNNNGEMTNAAAAALTPEPKQNLAARGLCDCCPFDGSGCSTNINMHLPQLLCHPDHHQSTVHPPHDYHHPSSSSFGSLINNNNMNMVECSQNLLRLTSSSVHQHPQEERDWSFLDKLLASSHQTHLLLDQTKSSQSQPVHPSPQPQRFPFHYLGFETDNFKFSKFP